VRLNVVGRGRRWDEEGGKYLAIQIWSPNTAKAISSNVAIVTNSL